MKIKLGHLFFASLISLSVVFSTTSIVSAIGLKSFSTSILSKVEEDEDEEKEYDSKSSLSTSVVSIGSLDNTTFASGSLSKINLNNTASDSLSKVNLYNTTSASGYQPKIGGVELPIPSPIPLPRRSPPYKSSPYRLIKKIDVPGAYKLIFSKGRPSVRLSRRHLRKDEQIHRVRIELTPTPGKGRHLLSEDINYRYDRIEVQLAEHSYGSIDIADIQRWDNGGNHRGERRISVRIGERSRYGYFYIKTYTPEERYQAGARQWENEYRRIDLTFTIEATSEAPYAPDQVIREHFFVFLGKNY